MASTKIEQRFAGRMMTSLLRLEANTFRAGVEIPANVSRASCRFLFRHNHGVVRLRFSTNSYW